MRIIKNLFRSRNKPSTVIGGGWNFLFGGTPAGKAVNEITAMQTSAVYACVRILAEAVASLPLHVYQRQPDGGKAVDHDHPLYHLLHDEPNDEMTSFVWRETLMSHLLLWGNAYAQVVRDGRGYPIALYPLLPNRMTVERANNGRLIYTYQSDKGVIPFRREDILHIPGLGFDGLIGYSPIAMAKNAVGMSIATEEYGSKFFANGATPGGILEHPGTIKDIKRVRESWEAGYQGVSNAHKTAILEEGMKFNQITIPPEQAQFLETRKYQIGEIARIFRVPPHMVGDLDRSSFSNIEQQSLEFVKYTLDPWVVRWEMSLQQSLLLPGEKAITCIKFNVDGLLRGDFQTRMAGYSTGIQNGFLCINDVRALEDLNLLSDEEGGNLHFVNGNMVKLKDVGAAYARNIREDDTS